MNTQSFILSNNKTTPKIENMVPVPSQMQTSDYFLRFSIPTWMRHMHIYLLETYINHDSKGFVMMLKV